MTDLFTQRITLLVVFIVVVFCFYYSIMQIARPTYPHFPVKRPRQPLQHSYYPCRSTLRLVGGHLGRLQKVVKVLAAELLDSTHSLILRQWQIRERRALLNRLLIEKEI